MKKLISGYTFDASEKKVTFTGYTVINLASVLLITNVTDNIIIYNFADATLGGTVATNVLTLTYSTTSMDDADKLQIWYDDESSAQKAVEQVTDWTAVAQNAVAKSGTLDCALHAGSQLAIQAFLDSTTAHTGTEFIVQVSSALSGDEDWQEWTRFVGLIGTANSEAVTNNPLAAGATSITCASTTGYTVGLLFAIEDATLVNSELCYATAIATNTSITTLDGVTLEHQNTAVLYNIALNQVVMLSASVVRARVLVNNGYDADGSTLNYKVRCTKATTL